MKHPDHIDGQRVRLHPATLEDRQQIYQALARSDLTDILLGHPSQDYTPLLSYEAFCDDYKQYYFDDSNPEGGRCFVIEVDGQAIGQVNYNDIERDKNRTELDIWMFAEHHCGHGYGSEALRLLCDYLRSQFNVEGFYIKPSASNPRAIRAYEKAGFRRSALSAEEAQVEYGEKDSIDTVYMTRNIEQSVPGDA
ncbi:TPA: hypothetical protein DIT45_01640 [Candidatus Acetothermia bacterium]|nr:hypothetical protein [Candidatus Acetothermia bacterium]